MQFENIRRNIQDGAVTEIFEAKQTGEMFAEDHPRGVITAGVRRIRGDIASRVAVDNIVPQAVRLHKLELQIGCCPISMTKQFPSTKTSQSHLLVAIVRLTIPLTKRVTRGNVEIEDSLGVCGLQPNRNVQSYSREEVIWP